MIYQGKQGYSLNFWKMMMIHDGLIASNEWNELMNIFVVVDTVV